ncbi:MAG: hypothetical protein IJ653_03580 [Bacteroidales bacterium]|nr:hypothetical protein [Bacteroidales bacterium]
MKYMKKVWLVTTDHLEDGLWFREMEDFKVGMNYVAVQVSRSRVVVLAFILMSNHVHFVLYGTREDVLAFIHGFKARYSRYLQRKYGLQEHLRDNDLDLQEIPEDDGQESLERAIAYVQMNSVAANICLHASQYPWGSGDAFFNPAPKKGRPLGALSIRSKRRILHCACELPDHWTLCDEGYILPSSYLNIKYVEQRFQTPRRMNYFLVNSSKAKRRLGAGGSELPSFRDQTILSVLPDLCRTLFGKSGFEDLSETEQPEMLRQLRFRFGCQVNQLARVTGLSYDTAARLLDGI